MANGKTESEPIEQNATEGEKVEMVDDDGGGWLLIVDTRPAEGAARDLNLRLSR